MKEHNSIKFVKVDVDVLSEAAANYNVRSVPTFIFLDNGRIKSQVLRANVCATCIGNY